MGETEKEDKCPLCNCIVPLVLLDLHVNSHLDEEEVARDMAMAQRIASMSDPLGCSSDLDNGPHFEEHGVFLDFVSCDQGCNQDVPIHEWDSHCLQHRLALEDAASNLAQSCDRGLSKRARHSEGQPSEWQLNKCLRGKTLEENVKSLVGCQVRETVFPVKEGVIRLLQKCLEADLKGGGFSTIVLSGYVEHFESRHQEDLGWGCGWRNIQMLSSHLLMQNPEAKNVLFGGCGFVPDILALQRWLEIAWAKGFDTPGAEYFDWEIDGTQKWIGTTECAALLRSFGMYARIVDFQAFGMPGKEMRVAQKIASGSTTSCYALKIPESGSGPSRQPSPVESEEGECTVCGEFPIQGTRYCHANMRNNDLCVSCMIGLRNSANKQDRVMAEGYSAVNFAGVGNGKGEGKEVMNKHQQMVDWVWNYFMEKTTTSSMTRNSSVTSALDRLRQPITLSKRSPLYFQHEGHSRTIVGVERRRRLGLSEEVFLLVLDPSQRTADLVKALRERRGWQKLLKRGLHTLKKAEYQLCYVDEGVAKGDEYESLKVLSSGHYSC